MYIQHEVGTSVHHSEHSPSVIILSLPIYWEILIGFNLSSRIWFKSLSQNPWDESEAICSISTLERHWGIPVSYWPFNSIWHAYWSIILRVNLSVTHRTLGTQHTFTTGEWDITAKKCAQQNILQSQWQTRAAESSPRRPWPVRKCNDDGARKINWIFFTFRPSPRIIHDRVWQLIPDVGLNFSKKRILLGNFFFSNSYQSPVKVLE